MSGTTDRPLSRVETLLHNFEGGGSSTPLPSSPSDGQYVVYDAATQSWTAQTILNANGVSF